MQVSHWKNAKPYPSLLGGKGDGVITLAFFVHLCIYPCGDIRPYLHYSSRHCSLAKSRQLCLLHTCTSLFLLVSSCSTVIAYPGTVDDHSHSS